MLRELHALHACNESHAAGAARDQGSPSIASRTRETYRHAWSVTGHRPGLDGTPYLYTLTLSCPDEQWPQMAPLYRAAQESFRLTAPTGVRALMPALIHI